MNVKRLIAYAAVAAAAASFAPADSSACGGCFVQQSESTQVSSHRMILSVALEQTTLWDQITYSGAPESFAWVLPTKGEVDVELSSDALFVALDQGTAVTVASPQINCAPPSCLSNNDSAGSGTGNTGNAGGGGVQVIASEVVGPYETVQLQSTDPAALQTWLADHGYQIPEDVAPVIDAYVDEGFNFLAMRLVPGQGVDSMRPVRVTTVGASPVLPLRMVAAGTGAVTPITLWVFGEGRYEPANFSSFEIDPADVVWDWDTSSSNYTALRDAGFAATDGAGWLVESAQANYPYEVDNLVWLADYDPVASGYGDQTGEGAVEEANADLAALVENLDPNSIWVTRFYAELARSALANDLDLGATPDQTPVYGYIEAASATGTPPACPPSPCGDDEEGGILGDNPFGNVGDNPLGRGGCTVEGAPGRNASLGLLLALFALGAVGLRRR